MKLLTTTILLICSSSLLRANSFELDSTLLALEQQAFYAKSDTTKNSFYYKKAQAYIREGITSQATLRELRRVRYTQLPDSCDQIEFLWNAAVIMQLKGETDYASFYYYEYQNLTKDSSVNSLILNLLINKSTDTALFNTTINKLKAVDSSFACLSCINNVYQYELKNKKNYKLVSRIIPGLGTVLAGDELLGGVTIALHGALVYSVVVLVKSNMYINTVAIGLSWVPKIYVGNLILTEKTTDELEAKKRSEFSSDCQTKISLLLKSYPILLR
jgi:hypothetical protein